MAHFASYNTSDPNTGNTVLEANQEITAGPMQTEQAQKIAGSVFSDQKGTLKIQQSFDGINWDISESVTVEAKEGKSFEVDVIAPAARLVYKNGSTKQGEFRLFARTFVSGRD